MNSMESRRRQGMTVTTSSAPLLLLILLTTELPCQAADRLTLVLPGQANIELRNRQTLSGVRLQDLSKNWVNFVKGSKQSVPTASVAAITFEGRVVARQNLGSRVRGGMLKACRTLPEVLLSTNGLRIKDNGTEASLNLQLLSPDVRRRILRVAPDRKLMVISLRFGSAGQVTMSYQDCPVGI